MKTYFISYLRSLFIFSILLFGFSAVGQVGIKTDNPKAALDVNSTSSGILIPRMTALQAEIISAPSIGELVYSTTSNGVVINNQGFWYYDGTIWKPFAGEPPLLNNIYNSDGTLTANRTVSLNAHTLSFDNNKLYVDTPNQRIGIGNTTPSQNLDVSGKIRVRTLTQGNVVSLSDGTLTNGPKVPYGTVKESLRTSDHNGWYKLDGRLLNSLSPNAQIIAAQIGLSGNLINANGLLIRQGTPWSTGGNTAVPIVRAQLPSMLFNGNTSTDGLHSHTKVVGSFPSTNYYTGTTNVTYLWKFAGTAPSTTAVFSSISTVADHTHTGGINSGGSSQPINIQPESIAYTYFIYLGQ